MKVVVSRIGVSDNYTPGDEDRDFIYGNYVNGKPYDRYSFFEKEDIIPMDVLEECGFVIKPNSIYSKSISKTFKKIIDDRNITITFEGYGGVYTSSNDYDRFPDCFKNAIVTLDGFDDSWDVQTVFEYLNGPYTAILKGKKDKYYNGEKAAEDMKKSIISRLNGRNNSKNKN